MSSRSGLRRTDGQRVSPTLAPLCAFATPGFAFIARHPTPALRRAVDVGFGLLAGSRPAGVTVRPLAIPGPDGPIPARLHEPDGLADPAPLLVYLHGGGWVVGSLDSHERGLMRVASRARCRILAVGYRKAPEHHFPAAYDDAMAAFTWAHINARALGADPARLAVGGDSAGGNLAAAVALTCGRDGPHPSFAWLLYPVADCDLERHASADQFRKGPLLSVSCMRDLIGQYAPSPRDQLDPRCSPVEADLDTLQKMPPTYLGLGGMDPLRDGGLLLGRRLQEASVPIDIDVHQNQPHGFGLLLIEATARAAMDRCIAALARGLEPHNLRSSADHNT